ncbi:hypothetical protein RND81_12G042100 [Saponaria officinalis]|uniref:GAG-pre-integrase domain-containing protein n=1 Tax=Saponaria officinalis TaxID=3572 RepID=A0AAW1H6K1_SAPOF
MDQIHDYENLVVYVGNSNEVSVLDIGKVHLKLTFGKVLTFDNVLYVLDMRRNLISGALLNKAGLKLILESDKSVLSKNGQFVDKGFCNDDLFVLDVEMNTSISSTYMVESIDIWYSRLGHVNTKSIKRIKTMNLLPNLISHDMDKSMCGSKKNGIIHEFSAPYTYPKQNCVAERKNRTLKDMMNAMLLSSGSKTSKGYFDVLVELTMLRKNLKKFGYFDVEPARTPFDASLYLKKNLSESVDQAGYVSTRYTHNPGHDHWYTFVRLFRYLKGTAIFRLSYCGYPLILERYCEANWISESNDIHSTSDYVFILSGAAVSWISSKQTCIARSTME